MLWHGPYTDIPIWKNITDMIWRQKKLTLTYFSTPPLSHSIFHSMFTARPPATTGSISIDYLVPLISVTQAGNTSNTVMPITITEYWFSQHPGPALKILERHDDQRQQHCVRELSTSWLSWMFCRHHPKKHMSEYHTLAQVWARSTPQTLIAGRKILIWLFQGVMSQTQPHALMCQAVFCTRNDSGEAMVPCICCHPSEEQKK